MGLSRQVAVVACGRVATTASIFVVNALLARAWSLPDFGRFSAVWILGNTLAPVFLLGVPTAVLYRFPRLAAEQRRSLVWQATLALSLSAACLAAVLLLAGDVLSRWMSIPSDVQLILPFTPYVLSIVASGHVEAVLVAQKRPVWQAALSLVAAIGLVCIAAGSWAAGWDVASTLWALSAVGVARATIGWGLLVLLSGRAGVLSLTGFSALMGYAARIGVSDAVGAVSRAVDRVVVLGVLGTADLALYHVGAIEVPVSLLLAAVVTVLVPEVSRLSAVGQTDAVADLFRGAVGRLSLLILPLFCFLFVHADTLIAVYLPGSYAAATDVFRLFLLALPLRCAIYNPILVGTGRASWALYGSVADLLLNICLSLLLVHWLLEVHPPWALLGPAAATVMATYLQVTVLLWMLAHALERSPATLLPWRRLARVGTVGAGAALASGWLVSGWTGSAWLRLLLAGVAFGGLVLLLLRSWHRPDWDELTGLGRSIVRRVG